ncbi:MAG: hypothetical protein RL516_35 [Bacteroidota bacterium]
MLVRIFRSTQFYPIALIVLFSIVINVVFGFLREPQWVDNGTIFFQNMTNGVHGLNHWLVVTIVFVLVTSQALHLNYTLNKHEIFFKQSWLPALFYLVFSTQFVDFLQFSPLLLINSVFIFVLDKIFSLYKNQKAMGATFDVALLIAIVALLYAPAAFFVLLFFIGVAILKPLNWRDLSIGLIGLIVPLSIVLVGYFLNGSLLNFINQYKSSFTTTFVLSNFHLAKQLPSAILLSIVFILSLMKIRNNYLKNVTKSRLCQQILLLFTLISILTIPFTLHIGVQCYMLLIIPFSAIIAYYFLDGKKIFYQELLLLIIIANWVYSNFII